MRHLHFIPYCVTAHCSSSHSIFTVCAIDDTGMIMNYLRTLAFTTQGKVKTMDLLKVRTCIAP